LLGTTTRYTTTTCPDYVQLQQITVVMHNYRLPRRLYTAMSLPRQRTTTTDYSGKALLQATQAIYHHTLHRLCTNTTDHTGYAQLQAPKRLSTTRACPDKVQLLQTALAMHNHRLQRLRYVLYNYRLATLHATLAMHKHCIS
jgi:hypothetical protein